MGSSKSIPFEFVFDILLGAKLTTKPMFGCTAIYINGKIVLILRSRDSHTEANGVWLATTAEHHASLRKEFPSMRSIGVFGEGPTGWQNIPESAKDFESSVEHACQLILRADPRIGKIPKPRTKKVRKKVAAKK